MRILLGAILGGVFLTVLAARAGALAGASGPAPTPAPPSPEVAAAMRKLQAGDAAGAAKALEAAVSAKPSDPRAWRGLGLARLRLGELDGAEAAFRKVTELQPDSAPAMYNMGAIAARRREPDRAFEWLVKAKATGRLDMTYAAVDPDLESLRKDARFAALMPGPEFFAKPFVETVSIIREWDGEAANDQFGWIARDIGDVDGDGAHDVVTSAPTRGESAGRVYAYSSRSGRLLWSADGKPGDQLGNGVESAGDVDRDGVPDVIAGAPGGNRAAVYSGRDGRVLRTFTAGEKGDSFGQHVSGVGDFDGDGSADLIVGAPGNNAAGKGAGRAYVYSGRDGRLLLTLSGEREGDGFGSTVGGAVRGASRFLIVGAPQAGPRKTGRTYVYDRLAAKPKFVIESDETGAALGSMFVSVAGDVDGDGVPDIYASDWSNGARGPSTGRIYVHSGKSGQRLLTLTGGTPGEGFGIGAATAGDVDGDGRADLVIGAWQFAGAAASGGKVTVFSGRDGSVLREITGRVPGETLGFDAVGIGDVDGDGAVDLLITSAWSGVRGYHSGRMYIVSSGISRRHS
ncbi:MAG: FG-GAP-like repeat-containing protein [Acidobacteriota bacterium]